MQIRFSLPVLAVLGAVALGAQAQTSIDSALLRAKQRAEVRAAVAAGEIPRGELNPVASEAQLEQVRLAGERALSMSRAVAAR